MGKFLIPIAIMTSITAGLSAYRFIDHAFSANIGFITGYIILMASVYFINTSD
jgi:hypothetical protein